MYACDFEYDGKSLSDFGFVIATIGGSSGVKVADAGSEITFVMSPIQSGKRFIAGGSKYDKCLETTFQICKNPSLGCCGGLEISPEEFRTMSRWLNRREFLWFRAMDWFDPGSARAWVRASFTLSRVEVDGVTYGIELRMQTDSPFCYGDEIVEHLNFTSGALSAALIDENDEIGETYPALTITCGDAGTLSLSDDITECSCSIDNCVSGEVITFSGDTKIIASTNVAHDIVNDFNYDFFRFGNTYDNTENVITASMPCTVELRYRPIYKDTL